MREKLQRICIFCGSNKGSRPIYTEAAQEMGKLLAQRHIELIYGGGRVGLMGAVADAVLTSGGRVTGVIPSALVAKELAHQGLTNLHVVTSMHERKALMAELADGFVMLPGGFGTFEEFCEILTWAQLGYHQKPCGVLNVANFYNSLLAMLDHSASESFVSAEHRTLVLVEENAKILLERLESFQPLNTEKWIDSDET